MANVGINILAMPQALMLNGSEIVPIVQGGTNKTTTVGTIGAVAFTNNFPSAMEFVIDGGGLPIVAGVAGYMTMPFDAHITSAGVLADQTGTIFLDVWRCTEGEFDAGASHPLVGDSICGGNLPNIQAPRTKFLDTILQGWTLVLNEGDVLAFNVNSGASSILRVTITLNLTRTVIV